LLHAFVMKCRVYCIDLCLITSLLLTFLTYIHASPAHLYIPQLFIHSLPTITCVTHLCLCTIVLPFSCTSFLSVGRYMCIYMFTIILLLCTFFYRTYFFKLGWLHIKQNVNFHTVFTTKIQLTQLFKITAFATNQPRFLNTPNTGFVMISIPKIFSLLAPLSNLLVLSLLPPLPGVIRNTELTWN